MSPASSRRREQPRPALPLQERRRLRSIGTIAGGLVGIGVAIVLPGLLFAAVLIALSGWGDSAGDGQLATWTVAALALGALFVAAGWVVSLRRLRDWPIGVRRRVTAGATSLAAVGALLADAAMVGVFIALEAAGIAPTELTLVPIAALLGATAGALIGTSVWPWIGGRRGPIA